MIGMDYKPKLKLKMTRIRMDHDKLGALGAERGTELMEKHLDDKKLYYKQPCKQTLPWFCEIIQVTEKEIDFACAMRLM